MSLTIGEKLKIARLRQAGWGWRELTHMFHASVETLRQAADPTWTQKDYDRVWRAKQVRQKRNLAPSTKAEIIARRAISPHDRRTVIDRYVPPDVLADRDRSMMDMRRDTTAMLCGDPLPGRSALDKRNG